LSNELEPRILGFPWLGLNFPQMGHAVGCVFVQVAVHTTL
jgi:hypothetical protein